MKPLEILMLVAVVAVLAWGLCSWASLPTVYRAHPSGECVKVEPRGSCDNPPRRYHEVWVDPDFQ